MNCMEKDFLYALLDRLVSLDLIPEAVCFSAKTAVSAKTALPKLLEDLPHVPKEAPSHGSSQYSG